MYTEEDLKQIESRAITASNFINVESPYAILGFDCLYLLEIVRRQEAKLKKKVKSGT